MKLSILGLKIFGQDLDLESSKRRHLRWGGGSLRAFRRAILSDPGNDNHKESAATKTSKSTFCCCGLWRLQGQNIVFVVFVASISCSHPQKPKRRGTQKRKGRVVENPRPKSSNLPKILPKPFQNHPKPSQNPPKIVPRPLPNP